MSAHATWIVGAWACTLLAAGCAREAEPKSASARAPDVPLVTVDTATLAVPLSYTGQLYVEHDALVYARTTGIVESIYVDLGTAVTAGQAPPRPGKAGQDNPPAPAGEAAPPGERHPTPPREP